MKGSYSTSLMGCEPGLSKFYINHYITHFHIDYSFFFNGVQNEFHGKACRLHVFTQGSLKSVLVIVNFGTVLRFHPFRMHPFSSFLYILLQKSNI